MMKIPSKSALSNGPTPDLRPLNPPQPPQPSGALRCIEMHRNPRGQLPSMQPHIRRSRNQKECRQALHHPIELTPRRHRSYSK